MGTGFPNQILFNTKYGANLAESNQAGQQIEQ